jgi:uncharacterized membrane protein
MPERRRRIIAGIGWVIGSLIIWAIVCNIFSFTIIYLTNERQMHFPEWTSDAYDWTAVGGIVLIPAFVALLAMRAKLPWTRPSSSQAHGFPIEVSEPRNPG